MPERIKKLSPEEAMETIVADEVAKAVAKAAAGPTAQEQAEMDVLAALRLAGGGNVNANDAVRREGQTYIIPANATLGEAAQFLGKLAEENEKQTDFSRTYQARPWDGAYCGYKVMKEIFGAVHHSHAMEQGFFGPVKVRPQMHTIHTAHNQTTQVPWGVFYLPGFKDCEFEFSARHDRQKGSLFAINVTGPKKYTKEIEGFFNLIEMALHEYSIYRGKAIDGNDPAEFLNINIDPDRVVYTDDVEVQLRANVWSVMEDAEAQRAVGLPLRRSVLLHGPYGAGKSLFLGLTAQKAVESGWTYIRCRPGEDQYLDVLQTAALYAPAVVAFEDVDNLASADASAMDVAKLLDAFDGVTAKGKEIIALLTTNHPEKIHKGMVRPGRLDAVIQISALDVRGVEKLVRSLVPEGSLSPEVDWTLVNEAMSGYVPAFIKEATDRSLRYAISRSKQWEEGTITIDTGDLVAAADGLRPQLEMMEGAHDHTNYEPPLERAVKRVVGEVIEGMLERDFLRTTAEALDAASTG